MIVGVGGQGTLLASKVLGDLFVSQGSDVKVSEVHGMSQRGGSVVTYVRFGEKVYSPIIEKGQADFILSFELLEAARWSEYLNPESGKIITNTQKINPMPVIMGAETYPDNILDKLNVSVCAFNALHKGYEKAVNIVLLGKLSVYFDFDIQDWKNSIKKCIKPQFVDMNLEAFDLGRNSLDE